MRNLQIGRKRFSNLFWGLVGEDELSAVAEALLSDILWEQEELREQADYKTGSVPPEDAIDLFCVVRYFQPKIIFEVGTFIGVSTKTMRLAAPKAEIYTCDLSNDIKVAPDDKQVHQYPKQTSHEMFRGLSEKGIVPDLAYVDGRLMAKDMQYIKQWPAETVYVLDDFEGVEKGVHNAIALDLPGRTLIYPRNRTAIVLPYNRIEFVRQEAC